MAHPATFALKVSSIDLPYFALCLVFVSVMLALYFLVTVRLEQPPSAKALVILCSLFAAVALLAAFSGHMTLINRSLDLLENVFKDPRWQICGVVLALVIYTPLVFQSIRKGLDRDKRRDLVAIAGFLVFVLLLFVPQGFDSIGQWETWTFQAYLEGRPSKTGTELVSRFWLLVPHVISANIDSGSFAGYHFFNLLMFWGQLVGLYGIFRKLRVAPLFAFLTTLLFLVYPVNTHLMSLRSFPHTFSKLALFAAVYLALIYRENPSRLKLLGIWLGLLFNVASNESAYAMILVIPLLWWLHGPRRIWREVNLTVIWYLAPVLKGVYFLLLAIGDRDFYGDFLVRSALESESVSIGPLSHYVEIIGNVYRQTFIHGWDEAARALAQGTWIAPTLSMFVLTAAVAVILARDTNASDYPSRRQLIVAFMSGLVLIVAGIGVLIWLNGYNRGLLRMYIHVPVGAAVALSSLIILTATLFRSMSVRKVVLVGLFLLFIMPALARMQAQHTHFVNSANAKAKILLQIVEQAPAFEPDAHMILMTKMPVTELQRKGVEELRRSMLDGAAYILYGEARPKAAYLCILDRRCSKEDIAIRRGHLEDTIDFSDIVLFRLNDDLSVELLQELPPELGGSSNDTYDPERLIDTSAPIPPRALTMLASARRD